MDKDTVVFRKWRDGFGVIALFPEIPTDCMDIIVRLMRLSGSMAVPIIGAW